MSISHTGCLASVVSPPHAAFHSTGDGTLGEREKRQKEGLALTLPPSQRLNVALDELCPTATPGKRVCKGV